MELTKSQSHYLKAVYELSLGCDSGVRVKRQYDYVLLDYPPTLGMLTVNALAAADSVLIPIQAQYDRLTDEIPAAASDAPAASTGPAA